MANTTKPLSKWLTRKAGKKPIGATPLTDQTDGKRVNNFDQDGPPAIKDGMKESDPNAMGPRMRQVYSATAGRCDTAADAHDDALSYKTVQERGSLRSAKPYPKIQRGAVSTGLGSKDETKDGPDGSW